MKRTLHKKAAAVIDCPTIWFHLLLVIALASGAAEVQAQAAAATGTGSFRLEEATIDGVHAALKSGQLTCRALVEQYLKRIEAYNRAGPAAQRRAEHESARASGSGSP